MCAIIDAMPQPEQQTTDPTAAEPYLYLPIRVASLSSRASSRDSHHAPSIVGTFTNG
jgi:hypothetical protein